MIAKMSGSPCIIIIIIIIIYSKNKIWNKQDGLVDL